METAQKENIKKICGNIWRRARHNAFAHKIAHSRYEKKSTMLFIFEILCSLISICFIIITYMILSSGKLPGILGSMKDEISFYTTLLSVIFALVGVFFSVLISHLKVDVRAEEHKSALGSYQLIAQKARMVHWPDMDYDEMVRIHRNLEENFQLLKARGREPSDQDFKKGADIFSDISNNPEESTLQSFGAEENLRSSGEKKS